MGENRAIMALIRAIFRPSVSFRQPTKGYKKYAFEGKELFPTFFLKQLSSFSVQGNPTAYQTVVWKDIPRMGVRQTYIWSQLNPKSKGKFVIKFKSSEIIKSLNP